LKGFLFTIIALFFINILGAQRPGNPAALPAEKIDSLLQLLKKAREDTNKVNTLQELYFACTANKNYKEAAKYNNEAWLLAKKLGYIKGEARCMVNKAYELQDEEKWEEMLTYSLPATEMLKKINDTYTKARCATITGYSYYYRTIYPEAIKYFLDAVRYWKELENDIETININRRLAFCLNNIGNYTLALEKASEALELSIKTGNKPLEASSDQSVSASYHYLKKYQKAREFLEKAIKINQATGDQFQFAQIQNSLAGILIDENNFSEAENHISTALKIYETPGAPYFGKQWCYGLFADVKESRGDSASLKNNKKDAFEYYREAVKDLTTALKLCEEINDKLLITEKYYLLGKIYRKLHNYSLSRAYLLKTISLTKDLRIKDLTAKGYHELSSLDSMEGNFKNAFENSKQYKIYSDSLAMEAEKGKTESFTIQAEINKKEEEIKLLSAKNKLKTVQADKESQRRKFAYTGIAALLISGGYGFYRYRRRKKMEMQQTQMKDRLNISRGLHDDMGSTLSSISVYSKVAQIKSDENNKEELNDVLEKISMASTEMVAEMNDTVWAINPKNDSMERIIQRMESFSRPMLATRNIGFRMNYEQSILTANLEMEKRKNFYLIFKEALNNAFKYSGCSEISVEITNSNRDLELKIKDNGIGFNVQREMEENKLTLSGDGLMNMKARAEEMKGDLQVNSIPGEGTEIRLIFPIP
jgi:signal transduction histidine kinase